MTTPQLTIEEIKTQMMKFARKDLVFGCCFRPAGCEDWGTFISKTDDGCWNILWDSGETGIMPTTSCQIIGSPLLLSDILQPVCDKLKELYDTTTVYWGCEDGVFEFIKGAGDYDEEDEVVFEWKLSTPYFNDLPEISQRQIHAILFPNQ